MAQSSAIPLTWQAHLLHGCDRIADVLGLFRRPLRAERLIAAARRSTGLSDFGEWSFEEPLAVLLRSYADEADLSVFGRFGARWDMLRYLVNLLRLREEEKRDPAILDQPVERPIFILGLPRSGTTFMHNLMALDRANLVPRCWQTIYPYPLERDRRADRPDSRRRRVARQFAAFLRLAPQLADLHQLAADAAQECVEITGHVIQSLRFDGTHYVPSYQRWLDDTGHFEAYRFHRRFLQHLMRQNGGGRPMLKSPDHIFAFDALLKVYPDARFIFVHRDPLKVLASVAKLTEVLRRPFTRQVDRFQIGHQVSNRWARGAKLLIEASERLKSSAERAFHVFYGDLVRDPSAVITAVYRHFGLPMSSRAEAAIKRSVALRPDGGYGRNVYHLAEYGLNPAAERRRYGDYMAYFQMEPEAPADAIKNRPSPMQLAQMSA